LDVLPQTFPINAPGRMLRAVKEIFAILYDEPARNGGSITLAHEFQGFFVISLRVLSWGCSIVNVSTGLYSVSV